ncbi:MAG: sugar isomerase [Oscillospiraceae bacterium]
MKRNSRKEKLYLNTISAILYQLINVLCGFILPNAILHCYGTNINGLVTSITQFLAFISLCEFGVGAVVQSALYGPLATNDHKQTSKILISAKSFFKKIAFILVVYTAVLMIFYPMLQKRAFDFTFTMWLVLIISISSFAQYYFGITYQILLSANQMDYIQFIFNGITLVLNVIACVILMKFGFSIHIVKLTTSIIFLLRPLFIKIYVNKKFPWIDKKIKLDKEPIEQKWNGLAQHVASVVLNNTDVIVLTLFSSLSNVSIYSVYMLVINGIKTAITASMTGVQPLIGEMLVKGEKENVNSLFNKFEWLMHTIIIFCITCSCLLIVPFIQVYTRGIADANYYLPAFGILISITYGIYCLRLPYNLVVCAAGHFKQTQRSAIIEAIINIVVSVACVSFFGLIGVTIGTLCAMTYRLIFFIIYLSKNILSRDIKLFVKLIITDLIESIICIFCFNQFVFLAELTYMAWFMEAIKIAFCCLSVFLVINLIFYKDFLTSQLKNFSMIIKNK